jgi:phage tail sheath gpL-like
MSSVQLYPEVKDGTSLGPRYALPNYLPIGVEGQAAEAGTGTAATPYVISRPSEADDLFGSASSLATLVKFLLGRGVPSVTAIASVKGATAPTETERKTAWALLESDRRVRLRLTDSVTQSDLVALADSAENADLINNKQIAFGGLAAASSESTLTAAATAIASKRFVLVGPAFYDETGTLQGGSIAAAAVAAEVSKNPDIADDLDTLPLPGFTGIEKDANGMPIFRLKVTGGTAVNDFETLLQGGVSPLRQGVNGGVEITHLRTTYVTDTTFDALMTRLIVDQLFVDVRDYCEQSGYLRRGNTQENRDDLAAGVEALLAARSNWLTPKVQADGTLGYGVAVAASTDGREVTVSYSGTVVRGISTILIDATLDIPA